MSENAKGEYLAGLLKGLSAYFDQLSANDGKGFKSNFTGFADVGAGNTTTASDDLKNITKNRYKNIKAFDHTRVKLHPPNEGCDYINGNWIDGFEFPKQYIATQGPVPASIPDFWYMVWQYKAQIIIKVTREVEGDHLKCHRYWPDPESSPPQKMVLIVLIEVEHVDTVVKQAWITRKFKLRKGSQELDVVQFSYEAWPDHGVPLTTREFLNFRDAVKKQEKQFGRGPTVIHCSAGVGRTGTYVAIDRVLEAVKAGKKSKDLDIDLCVKSMREKRMFMVQTEAQYRFCYQAILDGIRVELKSMNVEKMKSKETKDFIKKDQKQTIVRSKRRTPILRIL